MFDSPHEYKLLIPVLVNRGDSMVDRNVVLGVFWLVSLLMLAIPLWILISANLPLELGLGIFAGMQLAGLAFYIPLFLCHKNRGFRATSDGDSFSWAIFRRKEISWSSVTRASVLNSRKQVNENPSISFQLEVENRKKAVIIHFEAKSGKQFEQELKNRSKLL